MRLPRQTMWSTPLAAKCRAVAIGCNDPDLPFLKRSAPTVSKLAFFVVLQVFASGLLDPLGAWTLGSGDVESAFLQGRRQTEGRKGPLYIWPPRDPITSLAGTWPNKLYEVIGNMYGFADAPLIFSYVVRERMYSAGFVSHSLDIMCFLYFVEGVL